MVGSPSSDAAVDAQLAQLAAESEALEVKLGLNRRESYLNAKPATPALRRQASNREGEDVAPLPSNLVLHKAAVTLYEFGLSPPCCKVRALLHYYGVPYVSSFTVPRQPKSGLDSAYHKVPKLVVNGQQINDSAVIFRTLSPRLAGEPLTAQQVELEKLNNTHGLMGALEAESLASYWGLVGAVRAQAQLLGLTGLLYAAACVLSLYAGLLVVVTKPLKLLVDATGRSVVPFRRLEPSAVFAERYRAALGDAPFFHGGQIGPLDLSLYGTLACFEYMRSPYSASALDASGLRPWYVRVDEAVKAVRPIF